MPKNDKILLGHGSGGKLTRDLVRNVFVKELGASSQSTMDDGAILDASDKKLVFTTDSYVVSPLEFPGGNIGTLAVSGTVNDLSVMGAVPLYLSLGVILEEGLDIAVLRRIVQSIAETAKEADVKIVCGDTKVVEKGKGDKIFINTSGIGVLNHILDEASIKPGDKIIINGTIGDHGMTLLSLRKGFPMKSSLTSDCAPLNDLINSTMQTGGVKWMRDPTRGGVATALNELAEDKNWGIVLEEDDLPYTSEVDGITELLGLDPLYSANEGKVLMVVDAYQADKVLEKIKTHPLGERGAVIGEVSEDFSGRLTLNTSFNTKRTLGILNSDPLPRIC